VKVEKLAISRVAYGVSCLLERREEKRREEKSSTACMVLSVDHKCHGTRHQKDGNLAGKSFVGVASRITFLTGETLRIGVGVGRTRRHGLASKQMHRCTFTTVG